MSDRLKEIEERIAGDYEGQNGFIECVADVAHLLTLLRASEAENARLRKAYDEIGNAVLNIMEETEDEGDRIYFGSTNDADMLRSLGSKYHDWRMSALNPEVKS